MAIQVGGTTVVNDSRALQNIASVDATTAAAIGAAGVGGATNLNELTDVVVSSSNPTVSTNPSSGVGTLWINETDGDAYICIDATSGANTWANVNGNDGDFIPPQLPAETGGTVVTDNDYKRHTFTTSGNFVVSTGGDFNILVVSAGGCGGDSSSTKYGGGGGAGGWSYTPNLALTAGTYSVTVPGGMAGSTSSPATAGSATFGSSPAKTSTGGGKGGRGGSTIGFDGDDGGSGGGGAHGTATGGSGIGGEGNNGGNSVDDAGAGGGGYGSAGGNAASGASVPGGSGGDGDRPDTTVGFPNSYFAGGGGGGGRFEPGGPGGLGGGGQGGRGSPATSAVSGTANTGGGGGGGGPSANGGNGGSGVVIVTYKFQ